MRIAVISDTHDNIWKLDEAIPQLKLADVVLHCGDIISPFMIVRLGEGLPELPIHLVWGNNDGDKRLLTTKAAETGHVFIHGDFAELEFGEIRVAVNHYPEIARPLAESGRYDLVCYGHDHILHEEYIGRTAFMNPGELMGLNGRSTFCIFDTKNKEISWVEL
jgi:putative phosphoesterase